LFLVEISAKNDKFGYVSHILAEVRGDAQPWLTARRKAHCRLPMHVNWTFFTIYYGSGDMSEMCTAWLFSQRSRHLCT